eukprot:TRINITY_DN86165_c0_g1_i1.p1 TRINITY_DN86165_c0_g1~~TRINITY_DN86165_c0_g1_i1.p1  ORF type:complete len:149 (+),score=20.17 TRINITY_DN86165_c0_g1_i1:54-500(+)
MKQLRKATLLAAFCSQVPTSAVKFKVNEAALEVELSPTCANGVRYNESECDGWVQSYCGEAWARAACAKSCGICTSCELLDWTEWSTCSSTCLGGGRTRGRNCRGESRVVEPYIVESEQCNMNACPVMDCGLRSLPVNEHIEINVRSS